MKKKDRRIVFGSHVHCPHTMTWEILAENIPYIMAAKFESYDHWGFKGNSDHLNAYE
jgi:hypothetical protein